MKILNSRYAEISRLIKINRKPNFNSIEEIKGNKGKLDFRMNNEKRKQKRGKREEKKQNLKDNDKIYVPFYLYQLKEKKVKAQFLLIFF